MVLASNFSRWYLSSISISTCFDEAFALRWPWPLSLSLPLLSCLYVQFPLDMCTNLDMYRICACIFNSFRICAQVSYCIGFVPAYSILIGYVHKFCIPLFWLVWGFYAYMFNSWRICAQILCFDLFDWYVAYACMFNSWWICAWVLGLTRKSRVKDSLGTVKDSLGSMSAKDCVGDLRGSPLGM